MREFVIAVLLTAAFPMGSLAGPPHRPTFHAQFACGRAIFTLRTTDAYARDFAGPTGQSLSVRIRGRERAIRLDTAGQSRVDYDGEARLPASIGEMICLTADDGRRYLVLEYTCSEASDVSAPVCHGEREWFRYLNESGRAVDRGFMPQDPRYDALFTRLHLDRAQHSKIPPPSVAASGLP